MSKSSAAFQCFSLGDLMSVTTKTEELKGQHGSSSLVFLAALSGVCKWEEAGLERGDEVGPLLFHS